MALQAPLTPRDIDFLPSSYREAGIQRKNVTLRVVVVAAFIGLIGFAAIYQQHLRLVADRQLTELLPIYEQAQRETRHLSELQQFVKASEYRAELCTYLRHAWPRSQILAALAERLPESIELGELSIVREPLPGMVLEPSRPAEVVSDAAKSKLEPAQRDLMALRDQWDKSRVVVKIEGVTDDPFAVHRYFELLNQVKLFAKVEPDVMQRMPGDAAGRISFSARIILRPGYGQPNGPTGPLETSN
jgi:hypothetical protein